MHRRTFIAGTAAVAAGIPIAAAQAAPFASTRLSIVTRGEGRDVILIPGLTAGRAIWSSTVAAVPGYRYHLVQIAGFAGDPARGNSAGPVAGPVAAEIARYIASAGLGRPAVIGHSMGGIIALMLAARWPARVGRVMAVDILPDPSAGYGFSAAGIGGFAQSLVDQLTGTPEGRRTLDSLMQRYGGRSAGANGSDSGVVARATGELAALDLDPELPRITAPLAVVYAVPSDPQVAAGIDANYRAGYARARTARLRRIANSGHMIMYDQPKRFQAEVRAFLQE